MNNAEDLSASEDAFMLFYGLEKTIECIHFTNAVNNCISTSIKDPNNIDGFFNQKEFIKGKYDTEDLLSKTYEESEIFFKTFSLNCLYF